MISMMSQFGAADGHRGERWGLLRPSEGGPADRFNYASNKRPESIAFTFIFYRFLDLSPPDLRFGTFISAHFTSLFFLRTDSLWLARQWIYFCFFLFLSFSLSLVYSHILGLSREVLAPVESAPLQNSLYTTHTHHAVPTAMCFIFDAHSLAHGSWTYAVLKKIYIYSLSYSWKSVFFAIQKGSVHFALVKP